MGEAHALTPFSYIKPLGQWPWWPRLLGMSSRRPLPVGRDRTRSEALGVSRDTPSGTMDNMLRVPALQRLGMCGSRRCRVSIQRRPSMAGPPVTGPTRVVQCAGWGHGTSPPGAPSPEGSGKANVVGILPDPPSGSRGLRWSEAGPCRAPSSPCSEQPGGGLGWAGGGVSSCDLARAGLSSSAHSFPFYF